MSYTMKSRAGGVNAEGTYSPDELLVCVELGEKRTIASGAGVVLRGTVLGKITKGAATSAAKAGGNTGNATMSAITTTARKVGVYAVRMLTATTFRVEDPDGYVLGDGATGTAFADDVGFTMTAGVTPMVAGDGFDITVAAGSGKLTTSVAAANDGSEVPYAILAEDVDATSADADAMVYMACTVNQNKLIFGAGHTAATVYDPLRQIDIHLVKSLTW